ncbi:MAPEG family protein [Synechocystis sp. LKSZ1]|uniref:MAPEG family protein n=1 Tax=Synechocystis sp. LKSZ1 TaxID=3144951 RepID=UPI00336BD948
MTSFLGLSLTSSQVLLYGLAIAAGLVYLPYIVVAYGRVSIGLDLSAPRAMLDRLPDYAKRATWAHQNSFEVFSLFMAATLTVYVTDSATDQTSLYVLIFLTSRFLFILFYLLDWPWLRSPMWALGMVCIGGLFSTALL